jgi:hypothetical protein
MAISLRECGVYAHCAAMSQTPKVKAFLICDQVIRSTDMKYSIIGVFRRVHAPQFPVFHARFGLYMMLGELNGKYDFTIQFIDPTDGTVLGRLADGANAACLLFNRKRHAVYSGANAHGPGQSPTRVQSSRR